VVLEGGFVQTIPVQPGGTFILSDTSYGLLGTNTLGGDHVYTDLSPWVRSGSVTRPVTRQQGPLYSYPQSTMSVVLMNADGRFDPDNLGGPYTAAGQTELRAIVPIRIRAIWNGISYPLFDGFTDSWEDNGENYAGRYAEMTVHATDAQKVLQGLHLTALGSPAGAGETTDLRIDRILTAAGWYTGSGRRVLAPGDSQMQGTVLGDTPWNLMQLAADSEIGELYVSGSGAVVFRNRQGILQDTRSTTPQGVFGDVPGAAEAAGTEQAYRQVTHVRDDTTIANDVQATRAGSANMQEAFSQAMIDKYLFARTYQRTDLLLTSDAETLNWAQWVLYVAKNDEDRFDQLVIFPLRDPASLWPQVLGREVGDRIQVWRRPPGVLDTAAPWQFSNSGASPNASTFTVTTAQAASISPGDDFQLYTSGMVLKQPAVFSVLSLGTPSGGLVAVTFSPPAAAVPASGDIALQVTGAIVKDCFIRGIAHSWNVSSNSWQTTFTLQDASRYSSFWTLDHPVNGRLNNNALAY
jgi:hypothetical protein